MPGHARPFIGRQRAQALAQQVVMRRDGLAAFVLRLAQRLRGGLAPRIIERACQRQALVLQPFLRRAGLGATPGQGAGGCRQGVRGRHALRAGHAGASGAGVARSSRARGTFSAARRSASEDGYRHGWSDGTGPDAARSAPRPGHVDWPASHPPPAGPGARVVPWPRRRRTSWMRIRAGHALQTGRHQGIRRARHAADPRGFRVGLVLAFAREIQAGCQEAWHVPVHEEPQRRVGQALATRQLPRRFLPLLPREIHPAGIASVPAGDVRAFMRQDGAAGVGRQQLQQRQPEPQHVARAAPEPPMLPDAGIAFAVQVDRVQHRRAHLGAHLFDLAEQRRRVRGREEQAVFRAGWA